MRCAYASRIALPWAKTFQAPITVRYKGKEILVGAVQLPIEYQQQTSNHSLRTWSVAPEEIAPNPQNLETLHLTYRSGALETPGNAKKHVTLHLKEVEETEKEDGSKIFTLVYDHEHTLPICSLRNQALNETEVEALEIDPKVREEAAAEVRAALITAGSGHYSRLVSIHNQEGFNFVVDKLAAFHPYLNFIKDRDLRAFVRKAIILSFSQFYMGPSSTGAKYHPLDEIRIRGLVHHTLRVAFLSLKLAQRLKLSKKEQEIIVAGAMLHDICKGVNKNENGSFKWGFHTTADHGVFGAEWLEQIRTDYFPSKREEVQDARKRVIQTVRYHSNIWVDNYDTELTAENPIADWIVSFADFSVSHKHSRVHFPTHIGEVYPKVKEERHLEVVDEILSNPLNFEWEGLVDNWAELPAQTRKAFLIASMCFRQYEIIEEVDQQEVIQAIIAGEIPTADPNELVQDKKKLTIWAALTTPQITGMNIYLREDINRVLEGVKPKEAHWIVEKQDQVEIKSTASQLLDFFRKNFRREFWNRQKQSFLKLVNGRAEKGGSPGFSVGEFKKNLSIEILCGAINSDNYEINFKTPNNSIERLNELLQVPNFYDIWLNKERDIRLGEETLTLINKTKSYRDRDFSELSKSEQKNIQQLNRQLLEATYPRICPKSRKGIVESKELNEDLLEALMLKYGTLDMQEIAYQVCGQWSKKAKIRAILQASKREAPQVTIGKIEALGGYSGTAITKVETSLREKLNAELDHEEEQLKEIRPEIRAMLAANFEPDQVETILAEIEGADRLKYPRYQSRRIFARLKAKGIDLSADNLKNVKSALSYELDYIQRLPFNRMNRVIITWLMERYGPDAKIIFSKLKDAGLDKVIPILQQYEAEMRELEAQYVGLQHEGKKSVPAALKKDLLARAKAELEPCLPPAPARESVSVGEIPELEAIAQFMLNYELNMDNLHEFLAFARNEENYNKYHYQLDIFDKEIDKAVDLVFEAVERLGPDQRIGVYGDYDADGICGTVILMRALWELAGDNKEFINRHIPDRSRGFGPNRQSLKKMIDSGCTTIITNDNGASGAAEIKWAKEYAQSQGKKLTFIVTDHHPFGEEIPDVDALVHPKLLPKDHPAYYIAGAAVAWKVAAALFDRAGKKIGKKLLEYAAIATITDVVPMEKKSENRAFAFFGFRKFNRIYAFLQSLEEKHKEAAVDPKDIDLEKLYNEPEFRRSGLDIGLYILVKLIRLTSFDRDSIGFGLGPVLNAIGRMAGAELAVDLLLAETVEEALKIAEKLITANVRRKELQAKIEKEAFEILEQQIQDQEHVPESDHALVLHGPNWHRGIVGLVASTMAEHIQGIAAVGVGPHGSMRTIPGLHILKAIQRANELYRADTNGDSFFEKAGGHAGAAGYTLKADKVAVFREYLKCALNEFMEKDETFRTLYGGGKPKKLVKVEAPLDAERISRSFYILSMMFSPFGQQSFGIKKDEVPRPIFKSRKLRVTDFGVMGGNREHLQIEFEDQNGRKIKAAYFRENNLATKSILQARAAGEEVYLDVAFTINIYDNKAQLIVVDMQPSA